jgi:hypothetical protein
MGWGAAFASAWSGATNAARSAAMAVSEYAGAAYQRTAQKMSPVQMAMQPQQALVQFATELTRPPAELAAEAAKKGAVAAKDAAIEAYDAAKKSAVAAKDAAIDAYDAAKNAAAQKLKQGANWAENKANSSWGNFVVPAREEQIRKAYGTAFEKLSDSPAGSPSKGCPKKQAECRRLKKARDDAILSEHVYIDQDDTDLRSSKDPADVKRVAKADELLRSTGFSPLDIRNADDRKELAALGLDDPKRLLEPENSSFRARVYKRGNEYVVAYRGTQTRADWWTNVKNGSGLKSHHYTQSAEIAKSLKSTGKNKCINVSFTGHSLAGGLASHSAYLSGFPATTHNAAGLNRAILGDSDPAAAGPVDAYFSPADPLNALQDNRKDVLGGMILAATPWPAVRAALAGWLGINEMRDTPVMPQAYGERRPLPLPQQNKAPGILEGHGMPLIIEGLTIQIGQLGC